MEYFILFSWIDWQQFQKIIFEFFFWIFKIPGQLIKNPEYSGSFHSGMHSIQALIISWCANCASLHLIGWFSSNRITLILLLPLGYGFQFETFKQKFKEKPCWKLWVIFFIIDNFIFPIVAWRTIRTYCYLLCGFDVMCFSTKVHFTKEYLKLTL